MRRKNIYFGFGPTSEKQRKDRLTLYRKPKDGAREHRSTSRGSAGGSRSELVSALVNLGYKRPVAQRMAGAAKGSDFDSQLRDALKRNPHKGSGDNMAQKKRKSKKKRKNPMPAGLKKFWAKKRRARARRKATRKTRRLVPAKYDKRLAEVIAAMKSNPRRRKRRNRRKASRKLRRGPLMRKQRNPVRKARRITLKGFTASQIRTVASVVRRATGKRVRVVKP